MTSSEKKYFWFSLLAVGVVAWLFRTQPWDVQVAGYFYEGAEGFRHGKGFLSVFLRKVGPLPAIITSVAAMFYFIASFFNPELEKNRGKAFFLAMVGLLGMGLMSNVIFKGLAGRPRPFETELFGGMWELRAPFDFGTPGRGKSFVSGHASTGFFFLSLFFLWTGTKRWWGLLIGLAAGALIGGERVFEGAHWLSDILLCALLMFALSALLSPLQRARYDAKAFKSPLFWGALLFTAGLWSLLATPVYEDRRWVYREPPGGRTPAHRVLGGPHANELSPDQIKLEIQEGDLRLDLTADDVQIHETFEGFGWPGAKAHTSGRLVSPPRTSDKYDLINIILLDQQLRGTFVSKKASFDVGINPDRGDDLTVFLKTLKGGLTMVVPETKRPILLLGEPMPGELPDGFMPHGPNAFAREGKGPLLTIRYQADSVHFLMD